LGLAPYAAGPGAGIGPSSPEKPDAALGLHRARAATALMLALPGSAYLYQGEELGLPEVIELDDEYRQDPSFHRTGGEVYGRDGCRVPIPWEPDAPAFGFNTTGESWLPQPETFARFAHAAQADVEGSTLELYRLALALRAEHGFGLGTLTWLEGYADDVLAFRNGGVTVIANLGDAPVELPAGEVILASDPLEAGAVPSDTTVWVAA
ncbi:MAG: DUF3459 domain-containing protein, partial [Microcella pacifica]